MSKAQQNYINHIVIVLDGSSSMHWLTEQVIKVADSQVQYLAQRSKELDQETRVTVYTFADFVECKIYDKDVLRLPSMRQHYRAGGMTALLDATHQALDDLAHTWEGYGDHAFLIYVLTDGQQNAGRNRDPLQLAARLNSLPEHWTVATLVPNQMALHEAKKAGFPAANVCVWDATSVQGFEEAGRQIKEATDRFMSGRAHGVRGSRNLFSTGVDAVNKATITAAGLTPVDINKYVIVPVHHESPIREWVQGCGYTYRVGEAYYQLTKTETIQGNKKVMVLEKNTGRVYAGDEVRHLIGLSDLNTRAKPDVNPLYDIYVQSTSVNRKLLAGTKILVMNPR